MSTNDNYDPYDRRTDEEKDDDKFADDVEDEYYKEDSDD